MPNPAVPETRRCRSLTVDGVQCRQRSLLGDKFCVKHARFRHPISFRNGEAALPLLEDLNTIQVVASQVAQGLLAGTLEDRTARTILYACQIAALGCTRPARVPASREIPELLQPVADITLDDNGQPLGPDVPWVDPDATHPVPIDWDKLVERNETHYCQSGNLWCFGTHMINCCDDCRKRRLAVLAEAEINRQHFSHEQRSEIALNEMIERLRREAAQLPNFPPPSEEPESAESASDLDLNATAEPQLVTFNRQPATRNPPARTSIRVPRPCRAFGTGQANAERDALNALPPDRPLARRPLVACCQNMQHSRSLRNQQLPELAVGMGGTPRGKFTRGRRRSRLPREPRPGASSTGSRG